MYPEGLLSVSSMSLTGEPLRAPIGHTTKLVYPLETATPPKPKPTFYYPEDDDDCDVIE